MPFTTSRRGRAKNGLSQTKPEHVLRAIQGLDAGATHAFSGSKKCAPRHEGQQYPPKPAVERA
jgi:hypothetical protein